MSNNFDRIRNPNVRLRDLLDTNEVVFSFDFSDHIKDLVAKLDTLEDDALIKLLKSRGYSVHLTGNSLHNLNGGFVPDYTITKKGKLIQNHTGEVIYDPKKKKKKKDK